MNQDILFSIVVPVYNVEKYIGQCIESLVSQTYENIEIILVDDGSTDGSSDICDEYSKADKRVRVIHKQNEGVSKARNIGVDVARGRYIMFVDSDDFLSDKDVIQNAYDILKIDDADLVLFGYTKYYPDINAFRSGSRFSKANIISGTISEMIIADLYAISPCCKIIRKSLIDINQIVFQSDVISEDMEWSLRLALYVKRISVLKTDCYIYRQRDNSRSHTLSEKSILDLEENLESCKKLLILDRKQEQNKALMVFFSRFVSMYIIALAGIDKILWEKHIEYAKDISAYLSYGNRRREALMYLVYRTFGVSFLINALSVYLKLRS